jgi:hypothetical protein
MAMLLLKLVALPALVATVLTLSLATAPTDALLSLLAASVAEGRAGKREAPVFGPQPLGSSCAVLESMAGASAAAGAAGTGLSA